MSLFVILSKNFVLNRKNILKLVDFVVDSYYFTVFCIISRQKRVKMPT